MFELILTLIFVFFALYFDSFWFSIIGAVILLILILPGMYAMIFGAPMLRTSDKRLAAILKLADFKSTDRIVDLGCGDGKLIRAIANRGVMDVVGYEFSVPTYLLAKILTRSKAKVVFANFWKQDLKDFNVIICFLLPRTMLDFEKKIWPHLSRGTKVISNEFLMSKVTPARRDGRVYLYVKK